jgi:hypothetical protein
MGKHEKGYARVERDLYPTPRWVIEALAEHVDLTGRVIWEFAAGKGQMAEALKAVGAARVYCTDITDYGYPLDEIFDFTSTQEPKLGGDHDLITNSPFGPRGKLAEAFIEAGLRRQPRGGILALLLPIDFDSAKTRSHLFADCPHFIAKIVLRKRINWFERKDGKREAPKENHCWCRWQRSLLRIHRTPVILYSPAAVESELPYDANADFAGSIDECYRSIRQRVASGGRGWIPK